VAAGVDHGDAADPFGPRHVRVPENDGVVAVVPHRDESLRQPLERVETRGRREVAGVEHAIGCRHPVAEEVGEPRVVSAVSVCERDEHTPVTVLAEE